MILRCLSLGLASAISDECAGAGSKSVHHNCDKIQIDISRAANTVLGIITGRRIHDKETKEVCTSPWRPLGENDDQNCVNIDAFASANSEYAGGLRLLCCPVIQTEHFVTLWTKGVPETYEDMIPDMCLDSKGVV